MLAESFRIGAAAIAEGRPPFIIAEAGSNFNQSLDVALRLVDTAAQCGADATLFFNLAILLEDLKRPAEAADLYRAALAQTPDLAEAHYNLALLCEAAGERQEAIRHLAAYRKLSRS